MRQPIRLLAVVAMAALLTSGVPAQDGSSKELIDQTKSALSQWVETQQIISKERKDWQLAKDVLDQRIALLDSELGDLNDRIRQSRESIGETDGERRKLIDENDGLRDAADTLEGNIVRLETQVRSLLRRLPDPILDRVKLLSQRIPEDPTSTKATLGERYQNVIGVLNEVNKFNQDIIVTSELRQLPDQPGVTAEVQAIYIGLGQAYYVTNDGQHAGVGRPTESGWEWTAMNEIAAQVSQVVAIKNGEIPAYVPLPVDVQ